MAIILDPKAGQAWSEESHDNVMYTAIVVAWQMFGVAVLQLVTLLIGAKCSGVSPDWTGAQGSAERHQSSCSANLRHDVQYTKLLAEEPLEEPPSTAGSTFVTDQSLLIQIKTCTVTASSNQSIFQKRSG
ncbi:hypothetical protein CRM22_004297 [Opisthorchis felineus]|uniref:Uncharacterized protein n=1 Tax=Opisthorchis felineus TaxID=147828 RepID=A0A4S2M3A3_OPIFE|nr:hypothetical protein CRM22_004297 [Opisthorchis felineus]